MNGLGERRHVPSRPCPICGGHASLARGRGVRCAGFTLDLVAVCTREELAGSLALDVSLVPPGYRHRLSGQCRCGTVHSDAPLRPIFNSVRPSRAPSLTVDLRNEIYRFAFEQLTLRKEAADDLRRRGLTDGEIGANLFVSVPLRQNERAALVDTVRNRFGEGVLLRCPGFHDKNGRLVLSPAMVDSDGYFVPYVDELGFVTGFQVKVLGRKYLTPLGSRYADIYAVAGHGSGTLFVVEGGLKAIVAAALSGLWCFGVPGQSLQPEHVEAIRRLAPDRVAVALDRETNDQTERARLAWLRELAATGLATYDAVWEGA